MTSRLRRWVLIALVAVPLVLVAWVGWHAWQLNRDLSAAVDDAEDLQQAIRVGDPAAALSAAEALEEHSAAAADLTRGATWSAVGRLPLVGDDARGIELVSDVIADLAVGGVSPLAQDASDLNSMAPVDGRVDIARLESLEAPVKTARDAFVAADDRLSGRDPSGYVGPLRTKYEDLAARVAEAADALGTAERALHVLPTMLGRDGPRTYLLVFQNNAEVRATGGLPGAISVVTADRGKLEMGEQTTAVKMGEADEPVLPLSPAEEEIYGVQLGTYFLDANFTPDFPRAAELMRARWAQVKGQVVDGVIAVDPVAVSYVLGVTGPVDIGPANLSSTNAVDNLLHEIYVLVDDTDEQDELFKVAARTVFDELIAGGANPQNMLAALDRSASEHRLLVHTFDTAMQESSIAGTAVAGEVTDVHAEGPQVGMYMNDNTGAKMSYYLRTTVQAEATSCLGDGTQVVEGVTRMTSDAPEDAATSLPVYVTGGGRYGIDPGDQLVGLRIYGPVGGSIDEITLDGELIKKPRIIDHDGRPVTVVYPYLEPKQSVDVGWTVTSGPGQDGDVSVRVTPGIEPVDTWSTLATAC